jgi:hypothetical protein
MSIIARQSTARTVTVGPVLDADGVAVTNGVVGDLKIAKNGGAPAALNGSATLTHRHTGFYSLALTASDLDTVGQAEVTIDDTTNSMPLKELTVIEEAVYDALFAASAAGYGTAQTGDSFARLGAPAGASIAADIAAIEAQTDDIGAAGAGLTAIPWNSAWDAEVQSEVADALGVYDPPTNAEMEARTLAAASYATAANQTTILADLSALTSVAGGILEDTGVSIPALIDALPTAAENTTAVWAAGTRTLTAGTNLSIPTTAQIATAVFTTAITESYRSAGAAPTVAQALCELIAHMGDHSISGTTKSLRNIAGTTAKTFTLNDANSPTSITEAT